MTLCHHGQRGASLEVDRAQRASRVALIKELKTKASLSNEEVLRLLHLEALSGVVGADTTTSFLDYKKVPLVLEAQQAAAAATGSEPQPPQVVASL
mgnify:CR=1 FL=1